MLAHLKTYWTLKNVEFIQVEHSKGKFKHENCRTRYQLWHKISYVEFLCLGLIFLLDLIFWLSFFPFIWPLNMLVDCTIAAAWRSVDRWEPLGLFVLLLLLLAFAIFPQFECDDTEEEIPCDHHCCKEWGIFPFFSVHCQHNGAKTHQPHNRVDRKEGRLPRPTLQNINKILKITPKHKLPAVIHTIPTVLFLLKVLSSWSSSSELPIPHTMRRKMVKRSVAQKK